MLQKGTKAPYFEGPDENGNLVKLTDFVGKKLVLYFYPKDSTPGCTAEACDLRDNYERFLLLGYNVLGVSRDSAASSRLRTGFSAISSLGRLNRNWSHLRMMNSACPQNRA